ncbi:MAG: putative glycosyltransferase [Bacteroidia bacterium]|nr:putative glycosyltransferase [Bacteroidia bacterium]
MSDPQISFVVPLFNESESFRNLIERLNNVVSTIPFVVEIVLIDDGSSDNTPELMQQVALTDEKYNCIFLARNYGHQIALSAGLANARASEAVMVIDGDLQDPPELFMSFYEKFKEGYDVVYGIRKKRKETWLKKTAYHSFYRLLKSISYIDLPLDTGDFSLISRRIIDVLNKMPEESRYIRGMRSWIGFKQTGLEYEREERYAGQSKYSIKMLFKLAYNGIFNFSEFPIKFITNLGLLSILVSLLYFIQTVYKKFIAQDYVPEGFTALLFAIILFGGVQLVSLGIIGEYVLRIFFQVKGRPLYIVKNKITDKKPSI